VSSPYNQAGALVRGITEADIKKLPGIAGNVRVGTLNGFDEGRCRDSQRLAENLSLRVGDKITILTAKAHRRRLVWRRASRPIQSSQPSRSAWRNSTIFSSICAAGSASLLQPRRRSKCDRTILGKSEKIDAMRDKIERWWRGRSS